MPTRSDMTLRDLKDVLRDIVIWQRDRQDPSRYSWRLVGTKAERGGWTSDRQEVEKVVPPEHLARWVGLR